MNSQDNTKKKHILFYKEPAKDFNEALPIGNGRMGAMVYGRPDTELLQLNEDSIWSGGPRHRVNPNAKEGMKKVRERLLAGDIPGAEALVFDCMQGIPENSRHYMPLGNLTIREAFPDPAKAADTSFGDKRQATPVDVPSEKNEIPSFEDYSRTLNLENAITTTTFTCKGIQYERKAFVSAPDRAIMVRFRASAPGSLYLSCSLDGRDDYYDDNRPDTDHSILFTGGSGGTDGIRFAAILSGAQWGGSLKTSGRELRIEGADEALLWITARTSFYSKDYLEAAKTDSERLQSRFTGCKDGAAFSAAVEFIESAHIKDYRQFFDRVSFTLESLSDEKNGPENLPTNERLARLSRDPKASDNDLMELYFHFGRYLMISGSRPGSQPLNLQGIWNADMWPAWGSRYTVNINAEMNYWPAESCNLSECHEPFFDLLERICENGRKTAKEMYGAKGGYVCHHNTDIWGDTAPQDLWMPATIWPMGGAWAALHVFEHYEYTGDLEFLREKYHLLREAAEFFTDYLFEDAKGRLVTGPSVSPENTYCTDAGLRGCLCIGPSMDSQILTCLFRDVIKAANLLNEDLAFAGQLEKMLEKLPRPEIGKYGQIKEWAEDYDEVEIGHRHISQLFALYPADLITPAHTPELAKGARATMERRLSHGGGHTGWSRAWIANMWARLHDGEALYQNLRQLLAGSTNPNLFDNHPPFQIDGNFGGIAAFAESFLQCTDGEITLIPALPEEWSAGQITGLKGKGGLTIDLAWENGKLTSAVIDSVWEQKISLRIGPTGPARTVFLREGRNEIPV